MFGEYLSGYKVSGMRLIVNPHLPKEQVGCYIYPPHPFVMWLSRMLKRTPLHFSPWTNFPMCQERAIVNHATGTIICSPATYQTLKGLMKYND